MSLGTRDILLIIRATDQASTVVSRVAGSFGQIDAATRQAATNTLKHGAALTMLGAGLMAVGKQGFDALNSWRKAASEYNQESALTLTQIDQLGVSLDDVKRIGREVAMAIPAPFEEMQSSLFDIFSSMNVNTMQAQMLLEKFSKGAVAGQTDVQTAGRGSIAVMNAFKIPVEDVNKVMDTQFQLVRKGVGTYEEFAVVLGRVAPSAVRMGQSFETTAGMLAFLTRNGLSTQQAATSAARALDALSKVQVADRLNDMGISIRNANGDFRPLVEIIGEMNEKFKDLSKPERAKVLEDLFKGAGGTIQARRFFDTVFDNFGLFEQMVGEMQNSAGALDHAYDIMFEQPQTQMQLFQNKLAVIRTELGDHLLGAANKLVGAGNKILDWFEGLSPGTKEAIVQFIAFASAAAVVVGAVFAVIGIFLILKATLALAAVSFGAVLAAAGGIVLVIAAVAAAGYLIYRNWSTLGPKFEEVFKILKYYAEIAWAKLQEFAAWVMTWLPGVWENVLSKANTAWDAIWEGGKLVWGLIQSFVDWLVANVPPAWEAISNAVGAAWDWMFEKGQQFYGWLQENLFPVFIAFADMVSAAVERIVTIWNWLWDNLMPAAEFGIAFLSGIIAPAIAVWTAAFQGFFAILMSIWEPLWTFIVEVVGIAFNFVKQTIEAYLKIITGIFQFFAALFRGDWAGMWEAVKTIASGAWQWITNLFNTAFDLIFAIARGAMNLLWQILQAGWDAILDSAKTVPPKVFAALASLIDLLWDLGFRAARNLQDALENGFMRVAQLAQDLPGKLVSAMGAVGSMFWTVGQRMMEGLINGIQALAGKVMETARGIASKAVNAIKDALSIFSPSKVMDNIGRMTILGMINGINAMGPDVEREMKRIADSITGSDMTVPVGWAVEGEPPLPGSAGRPFEGATIDIDININGEGLPSSEIAKIAADEVKETLTEVYRELLTGPRR